MDAVVDQTDEIRFAEDVKFLMSGRAEAGREFVQRGVVIADETVEFARQNGSGRKTLHKCRDRVEAREVRREGEKRQWEGDTRGRRVRFGGAEVERSIRLRIREKMMRPSSTEMSDLKSSVWF